MPGPQRQRHARSTGQRHARSTGQRRARSTGQRRASSTRPKACFIPAQGNALGSLKRSDIAGQRPASMVPHTMIWTCILVSLLPPYPPCVAEMLWLIPTGHIRGPVPVLETSFGRHVPANKKIHHLTRLLEIIGPFEIERHGRIAASFAQQLSRNCQVQFASLHPEFYLSHLRPLPATIILLKPRRSIRIDDAINNEIEALPSGCGILVHIDQKPHPVRPRPGCYRRRSADIEKNL